MPFEIEMTLGEPIETMILLQQGDSPVLEVTLYDWDGTAWDAGYDATLLVGLSTEDPDEWSIAESAGVPFVENVFYFDLETITYSRGVYSAHVFVANAAETTPLVTPDDAEYSFKSFRIEVT